MITDIPAIVALHGACAFVYAGLAALILARPPLSRTGAWLAFACAMTAAWAAAFALAWHSPIGRLAAWMEVGRSAAWYGFLLHLYRRSVGSSEQVPNAFKTMGLLAGLVLGAPHCLQESPAPPAPPSYPSASPRGSVSRSATCFCWKTCILTRMSSRVGTSTCYASP
jgi:hypothetical protein